MEKIDVFSVDLNLLKVQFCSFNTVGQGISVGSSADRSMQLLSELSQHKTTAKTTAWQKPERIPTSLLSAQRWGRWEDDLLRAQEQQQSGLHLPLHSQLPILGSGKPKGFFLAMQQSQLPLPWD